MSRIKIISDPYQCKTSFLTWNGEWVALGPDNNPNSTLLGKQYANGFFPFKVQEIVQRILEEYGHKGERTGIVFEGPDDEWKELSNVCAGPGIANQIELTRDERALANARDILPYVKTEFENVYPIIAGYADSHEEICELLKKFRAASSDDVPVCVVGNYSSGKSTFINALLGIELLPSGEKPLTSRVMCIRRSVDNTRAKVSVPYMYDTLVVRFGDDSTQVEAPEPGGALSAAIQEELAGDSSSIVQRVRKALSLINERKQDQEGLGNLVEIEVPYPRADWMQHKNFVIFDTPGSNSNSNMDHLHVLQEAMRGMTDGLPVYVTEFSAIDSNDNAELYDEIKQIEALDERFAMIVVNKADTADLPEGDWTKEEEDYIKSTAVVRNLYAQGVYFVSSVMGLGAKLGGELSDRHYDRCYRQSLESYEDPESRYYTRLYAYNLLPGQLKEQSCTEAAHDTNLVHANSGLFSIECGVEDFASKYSAYNKCHRSDVLLRDIIEKVDKLLEESTGRLAESKRLGEAALDSGKLEHLEMFRNRAAALRERMQGDFIPHMNEQDFIGDAALSLDDLHRWERSFTEDQQKKTRLSEKEFTAKSARDAAVRRLGERFSSLVDSKDVMGLGDLAAGFSSDVAKAFDAFMEERGARQLADRSASGDLLSQIRKSFDEGLGRSMDAVEACSKTYWERCVEECRSQLLGFVSDGEGIPEEHRQALHDVIMDFRELDLVDAVPEIQEIRSPFNPDKLWKAPIWLQYNMELTRRMRQWRTAVENAHEDGFIAWIDELEGKIEEHIVDLNPELRKQYDFIRQNERDIADLQLKRDRLRRAEENVAALMAWRGEE